MEMRGISLISTGRTKCPGTAGPAVTSAEGPGIPSDLVTMGRMESENLIPRTMTASRSRTVFIETLPPHLQTGPVPSVAGAMFNALGINRIIGWFKTREDSAAPAVMPGNASTAASAPAAAKPGAEEVNSGSTISDGQTICASGSTYFQELREQNLPEEEQAFARDAFTAFGDRLDAAFSLNEVHQECENTTFKERADAFRDIMAVEKDQQKAARDYQALKDMAQNSDTYMDLGDLAHLYKSCIGAYASDRERAEGMKMFHSLLNMTDNPCKASELLEAMEKSLRPTPVTGHEGEDTMKAAMDLIALYIKRDPEFLPRRRNGLEKTMKIISDDIRFLGRTGPLAEGICELGHFASLIKPGRNLDLPRRAMAIMHREISNDIKNDFLADLLLQQRDKAADAAAIEKTIRRYETMENRDDSRQSLNGGKSPAIVEYGEDLVIDGIRLKKQTER